MNKDEFLQKLQEALSGSVPPETVRENLRYYSDYLREEKQKGRGEQEILEELGDPRLIARTILDTTPGAEEGGYEPYTGGFGFGGSAHREEEAAQDSEQSRAGAGIHYYDLNKWYWKLLGIVIVVCIFALVIAVISGILTLLIPLMPVILVVMFFLYFLQR